MSDEDERVEGADGESDAAADDAPERDPFGLLEESAGDREGDPFDALGDPDADEGAGPGVENRTATGAETAAEDEAAAEGEAAVGDQSTDSTSSEGETRDEIDSDPPSADSAADPPSGASQAPGDEAADEGIQEVSEPQVRPGAPSAAGAGADADADDVDRGDPFAGESAFEEMDVGAIDEDEVWRDISDAQARGSVRDAGKRDYAEVDKHRYCERCEHFTEPPEVQCTHEGTEILEFVDNGTVRVADCPIVAERRALQRGSESE